MLLRRIKRDDIKAHGLHSAFRDWAAEKTWFPRDVCEAALAHVVKKETEAGCLGTDLCERRRAPMKRLGTVRDDQASLLLVASRMIPGDTRTRRRISLSSYGS